MRAKSACQSRKAPIDPPADPPTPGITSLWRMAGSWAAEGVAHSVPTHHLCSKGAQRLSEKLGSARELTATLSNLRVPGACESSPAGPEASAHC